MNDKMTIFEEHLREEERAENTISKYLQDIKEFYRWCVGAQACQARCRGELCEPEKCRGEHCEPVVTKDTLLKYKETLRKSTLKTSSINSKISSLNSFFTWSEGEALKIKIIKCQKTLFGIKEKELTKIEYNRLLNTCKGSGKNMLIVETILKTGIRVSEIKYITYDALKTGKAVVNNKGKMRVILIPKELCIKLLGRCQRDYKPYDPVFVTRRGTPIDRKQIWQMMKTLAKKAKVPKEKVFPHNLRHLFAREFYKETHDIVKLASILGHSSIETTRIYTKETEDECRSEIEKIKFTME